MNHAELSLQLAKALGWPNAGYFKPQGCALVWEDERPSHVFDYRSPDVWGPVLEWLMREHAFAPWFRHGRYCVLTTKIECMADTLPEAVARAAIAIKERA